LKQLEDINKRMNEPAVIIERSEEEIYGEYESGRQDYEDRRKKYNIKS
jgi:hypothetical protein